MKQVKTLILGVETSCDETSIALYSPINGVVEQTTFSQIMLQEKFGGVVPEIASRNQLEKIHHVTEETFAKTSYTLEDIDTIAVTKTPGLPGSLAVGIAFSKGLAIFANKNIIGINHIEGHVFSPFLENPNIPFPHLCITASGGHTSIHYVEDFGKITLVNYTLDDAAGEAFDKIAKMMGLPYPGGPVLEKYAAAVNFEDFFHFPRLKTTTEHFSFSGIKTSVLYTLIKMGAYDQEKKVFLEKDNVFLQQKIASSLLCCISDVFLQKLTQAFLKYPEIKAVTFAGGVACNKYIRSKIAAFAEKNKKELFIPSPKYCTDNGAMIAFVGHYKAQKGEFDSLYLDRI